MKVRVLDTTLRDGEQTPGVSLTPDEKLRIAMKLDSMGVNIIEAGSAITSPGEREGIKKITSEGVEQAELSRRLARIEQEVGLDVRLEGCLLRDFDKKKVLEMFKKYSFKSLISRLDEVKDDKKTEQSNQLDIFSSSSEQVEWSKLSEIEEEWMADKIR